MSCERFTKPTSSILYGVIQKYLHSERKNGMEQKKKIEKKTEEGGNSAKTVTQNFSVPIFSTTQCLPLYISRASDSIIVSNKKKKTYMRQYVCLRQLSLPDVCKYNLDILTTSLPSGFQLVHLCLCVNVSVHIDENCNF